MEPLDADLFLCTHVVVTGFGADMVSCDCVFWEWFTRACCILGGFFSDLPFGLDIVNSVDIKIDQQTFCGGVEFRENGFYILGLCVSKLIKKTLWGLFSLQYTD